MSDEFPTLPIEHLFERIDPEWEGDADHDRIIAARDFAMPIMVQILAAQELGATQENDEQFQALMDRLYDGLRNRLTRQDLLVALIATMRDAAWSQAAELIQDTRCEVDELISSTQQ